MRTLMAAAFILSILVTGVAVRAAVPPTPAAKQYAPWKNGPSTDPSFFPIAVWAQQPRHAEAYKAIGINIYYGLHGGPTEAELAALKKAGLKTICTQNEVGLKHLDDPTIIGWMHGDEPDNMKQVDGKWVPVARPEEIQADYAKWRKNDPTRPIVLNLGQGVSNINYKGSWVRDEKQYVEFLKGCDIVSYDIYPVVGQRPETDNKLEMVAFGVDRLYKLSAGKRIVWNIVECTRISHPTAKPTPDQVKAEVWMSLVHGSTGICYFCHEFKPNPEDSAAMLHDKEMSEAIGKINRQITELAPVLNSPTVDGAVHVASENKDVPVDVMVKRHEGAVYVFAVAMRGAETRAAFQIGGGKATVEVLGEDRTIEASGGKFVDSFKPWGVHLYKIAKPAK